MQQTVHTLHLGDARDLDWIADSSVHLVVTSPPYWTLKKYNDHPGQLGALKDYETFLNELDKVWQHCHRVLVPGGRVVCVVGDVCLARRRNKGRHMVIPLHADISLRCRRVGLDYLTPILWYKIANASYEVENGSSFLGKPYEPNAIIKNDIEYILMLRKPGRLSEADRAATSAVQAQPRRAREVVSIILDGSARGLHPGTPSPISGGTRVPPRPYVLFCRGYHLRPVRRDVLYRPGCNKGRKK